MSEPHDAQREMEQRALRNVRGLVDRMESDERAMRESQRRMLGIAVAFILGVALVGAVVMSRSGPGKSIVVTPPAKPGQVVPQGPRAPQ